MPMQALDVPPCALMEEPPCALMEEECHMCYTLDGHAQRHDGAADTGH